MELLTWTSSKEKRSNYNDVIMIELLTVIMREIWLLLTWRVSEWRGENWEIIIYIYFIYTVYKESIDYIVYRLKVYRLYKVYIYTLDYKKQFKKHRNNTNG